MGARSPTEIGTGEDHLILLPRLCILEYGDPGPYRDRSATFPHRCISTPVSRCPFFIATQPAMEPSTSPFNRTTLASWQTRSPCRTEAFFWRLPLREENQAGLPGPTEGGRYQYLGSMPDLHSTEVTAISVKEPLLATGLANGRIFLWR